jgi:hypothetical protein
MAKSDRILDLFPSIYRAADRTKLLAEVIRNLAQPLEEADTHLFRIQRAHRIKVAEHADDIIRLAAALNLTAFHFEDILTDQGLNYEQKLDLMRERVRRIAGVHLRGLGTPWAVLEGAAIFLNATIVTERPGEPPIKHLDAEAFSHRATIEFTHLPDQPRDQIYLHENPLRRNKVEMAERWQMNSWGVESHNVELSPLRFVIRGVSDHTVLPSVFCPETHEGLIFNGVIPEGRTLVIDRTNGALLDDQPVDEWLIYFKGGVCDFVAADGDDLAVEEGRTAARFDGDVESITSRPFRRKVAVPTAPIGRSQWHFKVAEGLYDGGDFDYSVFATHPDPIGVYDGDFSFDGSVFDYPAAGVVGMAWDERIPCAFKLLLPSSLPPPKSDAGAEIENAPSNHLSRLDAVLPRFKAAGIRAFVDAAKVAWVLGESVIRGPNVTDGEGARFHATRLQSQNADILAPL